MAIRSSSSASGGRSRGRRGHRPDGSINVTPFVDVLLILLVVFMIVSAALPGLTTTSNVVVVVRGSNQGEVYVTQPDSLRIVDAAVFTGTKNEVAVYVLDQFSASDNFSYRGEGVVPYKEVETWARDLIQAGYRNVKLRLRRSEVPIGQANAAAGN